MIQVVGKWGGYLNHDEEVNFMQNKSKFSVLDRTFSWLLSVMMVFGVLFVAPITSVTAYTSHSRDEAVDWAKSKIGSYIDLDGYPASNPYQCVDLIKAYYQYLARKIHLFLHHNSLKNISFLNIALVLYF